MSTSKDSELEPQRNSVNLRSANQILPSAEALSKQAHREHYSSSNSSSSILPSAPINSSRGFAPSPGPTTPCSSSKSIMRAALAYPTRKRLCKYDADALRDCITKRFASSYKGSSSPNDPPPSSQNSVSPSLCSVTPSSYSGFLPLFKKSVTRLTSFSET